MSAVLLTPTLHGHDGVSCLARQLREALTAVSEEAVEVAHLENGQLNFVTDVCGWATRRSAPQVAIVAHLHLMPAVWPLLWRGVEIVPVLVGIEAWEPLKPVRARAMRRVRRAIAISHFTARGFTRVNPEFANLAIDVCWPAAPALAAVGESQCRPTPFALIVGRMAANERYKGHDELIDIWARVREVVPGARLVIAGTGDDVDRLRARVNEAGLGDAIQFEQQVGSERLAELYRDCAFLVLPSRREGFGYVLLEAMSAARACIAGVGAGEEIVEPGVTGLIVNPDSVADLTEAIVALFQDPDRCARMGAAGQQRARDVFSTARFAEDLRRALTRC